MWALILTEPIFKAIKVMLQFLFIRIKNIQFIIILGLLWDF